MKYVILFGLLTFFCNAEEIEQPTKEDTLHERFLDIIYDMWSVQDSLRDDKYNHTVQLKGKEVEDKIQKIIDEAEEREKNQVAGSGNGPKKDSDTNGQSNERLKEHLRYIGDKGYNPEPYSVRRGDMTQLYARDIPVRWRKRMEAYFISVVSEEGARIADFTNKPKSTLTRFTEKSKN